MSESLENWKVSEFEKYDWKVTILGVEDSETVMFRHSQDWSKIREKRNSDTFIPPNEIGLEADCNWKFSILILWPKIGTQNGN